MHRIRTKCMLKLKVHSLPVLVYFIICPDEETLWENDRTLIRNKKKLWRITRFFLNYCIALQGQSIKYYY